VIAKITIADWTGVENNAGLALAGAVRGVLCETTMNVHAIPFKGLCDVAPVCQCSLEKYWGFRHSTRH